MKLRPNVLEKCFRCGILFKPFGWRRQCPRCGQ